MRIDLISTTYLSQVHDVSKIKELRLQIRQGETTMSSPQTTALATPELLASILVHLTQATILDVQRVCKLWRNIIESMPSLPCGLFFQSLPTASNPTWNPILLRHFPMYFAHPDLPHRRWEGGGEVKRLFKPSTTKFERFIRYESKPLDARCSPYNLPFRTLSWCGRKIRYPTRESPEACVPHY